MGEYVIIYYESYALHYIITIPSPFSRSTWHSHPRHQLNLFSQDGDGHHGEKSRPMDLCPVVGWILLENQHSSYRLLLFHHDWKHSTWNPGDQFPFFQLVPM